MKKILSLRVWLQAITGLMVLSLVATCAVLVQHWSPGNTALMSLGLVLAQLAALVLPFHRSRELTTEAKVIRAPEARARPSVRS